MNTTTNTTNSSSSSSNNTTHDMNSFQTTLTPNPEKFCKYCPVIKHEETIV